MQNHKMNYASHILILNTPQGDMKFTSTIQHKSCYEKQDKHKFAQVNSQKGEKEFTSKCCIIQNCSSKRHSES